MKNKLKISVVVPIFNREKYIGRCIRSLMNQSIERNFFEIITIDDASTDASSKILKSYSDEIKIYTNKKNKGLSASLNLGIKKANGKYIVRVDSDDYVNKDFLQILYLYINHNQNADAVACDYFTVDNKEKILSRENCLKKPIGCGIIFRKSQIKKIGLYNKNFRINEEKDLMKRFVKKYILERIALPLYRYKRHKNSLTKGV